MENNTPNKLMYQSPTLRALRATTVTPRNSPFGSPNNNNNNNGLHRRSNQLLQHVNYSTPNNRFPIIHNPFESALRERLHLPLICSPSLFHRPSTPQLQASSQNEWTIEDVSFYNPAKVEVNDTQFTSITDPAEDAQAQAAISSFFKHQLIVPSPIRCPLRKVKLPLSILNKTDSAIKNGNKLINKRDACSQTELTLPSKLPKELEDLLKPYFTYTVNQQQSPALKKVPTNNCDTSFDHEARNASLRRKLFDSSLRSPSTNCDFSAVVHTELTIDSPIPQSPVLNTSSEGLKQFDHSLDNSPIDNKSSFGSLSPISKTINHCEINNSLSCTPTSSSSFTNRNNRSCLNLSAMFQSTPERSNSNNNSKNTTISMAYQSCASSTSITSPTPKSTNNNMSVDCTAINISNLNNSSKSNKIDNDNNCDDDSQIINDCDLNDSIDLSENEIDVTRLNDQSFQMMNGSFNNSSSNYETPTRRRRKYRNESRKNLSHSFSSYQTTNNVPQCELEINFQPPIMQIMNYCLSATDADCLIKKISNDADKDDDFEKGKLITKVDSGFNEM